MRRGRGASARGERGRGAAGNNQSQRSSGRAASARGSVQHREGDWKCRGCDFQPNFGFRHRCWRCGAPRAGPQSAGGGGGGKPGSGSSGPLGADGKRPLLGGGARRLGAALSEDKAPSFRVPGASAAAKAEAGRAAAAATSEVRKAGVGVQSPGARGAAGASSSKVRVDGCDADGFRLVQRRGARGKPSADEHVDDAKDSDADDADMGSEAAPGSDADADDDQQDDDGAESEPEPTELRRRWQQEIGIVKRLSRQGLKPDHPAMVAACDARDGAEQRWRGAKPPAPLATRLGWAQKKVDRAVCIQAETRQALVDLDREYNEKRSALQARMDEDTERVRMRRQQLQAVQDEAGGRGAQGRRAGGGEAVRRACDTLRRDVAPALVALAEQLGSGSEASATVNGLLASLTTSQKVMEEALEGSAPTFDMADGDGDESVWSESHDLLDQQGNLGGGGAQFGGEGGGHLQRQQLGFPQPWQQPHQHYQQVQQWQHQRDLGQGADGGGSQQWQEWHQPSWAGARRWREEGHGQWTRTSWADAWEQEQGADAEMEEQSEPQCKHRRQGSAACDGEGAAVAGSGGQTAAGQAVQATPQQQSAREGDRQHAEMLSNIVAAALSAGVQPVTSSGDELQLLDSHQLAAWAAENLPQH